MGSRTYWILAAAGICIVVLVAVKIRRDTSDVGEPGAGEPVKHVTTKKGTGGPVEPPKDSDVGTVDATSDTVEPAVGKAINRTSRKGYSSIQSAIDNATDGDVIEVAAGTHYESIDFKGKSITVQSLDPSDWDVVQETVIDANDGENAVYFGKSEGVDSVLKGFKITGGAGAGIYCSGASPTIGNCLITQNGRKGGDDKYGGMYNHRGASPNVTNCVFSYNDAEAGGGMYNSESSATVTNCVFYSNEAKEEDGGGMYNERSGPTIINCTFYENECEYGRGGAIYNDEGSDATVSNCIFWSNRARGGEEIYNKESRPTFSYCSIRGGLNGSRCGGVASVNGGGNITNNPGFYDHSKPDGADKIWGTSDDGLRLAKDSPCIDAGDNSAISEPGDITGNERMIDAASVTDTGNGTAPIVDMGAYEYNPRP